MMSPIKSVCTLNHLKYQDGGSVNNYIHIRLIITCLGKEDGQLLRIKNDTT